MGLTGQSDATLELILFGGKGGVGKTTCAASAGLYLFSSTEISAKKAFSALEVRYEKDLKKIIDTSTYLDPKTVEFDEFIIDTPLTDHVLRLQHHASCGKEEQ